MVVGVNHPRNRHHRNPVKKGDLRCTMIAQNSSVQRTQTIQFQQEQLEWDKKWDPNVPLTYSLIKDSKDISKNGMEMAAVYYAMMTWSLEIPLTLKLVKKNQKPKITIEFTDSNHDKYFKEKPEVLAFAYYPGQRKSGIIKFNDDYHWSLDGKKVGTIKTYNMVNVLIHEIGHCLGLTHLTGRKGKTSVMHPFYNGKLKLSEYDKLRIVKKYSSRPWKKYQDYKNFKEGIFSMINNFKT